jgi:hypothetical protein
MASRRSPGRPDPLSSSRPTWQPIPARLADPPRDPQLQYNAIEAGPLELLRAKHIAAGHMQAPANSIPMLGGPGPFDYITMRGLFTVFKVREHLDRCDRDPGWYEHPRGTVASPATREELKRDGIQAG